MFHFTWYGCNDFVFNNLYFSSSNKDRKNEAEKYFLKAIQLDPTKGNCYMHYGMFSINSASLHILVYYYSLSDQGTVRSVI